MYRVEETQEYIDWFEKQSIKEQAQIQARIARIRTDGHFGTAKMLDKSLAELKWRSGRRIYFTTTLDEDGNIIILLLGGNKSTQAKDIRKAKSIIKSLSEDL
ncbi:MAG: putative addiction module killer protein [Bacteriovoracaceae bacterium]|jgi:putative addiction module killer protein